MIQSCTRLVAWSRKITSCRRVTSCRCPTARQTCSEVQWRGEGSRRNIHSHVGQSSDEAAEKLAGALRGSRSKSRIYQTSLMSGLLAGVYEGEVTMKDLRQHGDFGLGTFNQVDGELIAFDGHIFQLRSDGTARPATMDQKTPFAVMTFFEPVLTLALDGPLTREAVQRIIDREVPSDNVFCAIRVDGEFSSMDTRTAPRQERPYKPLLTVLEHQAVFSFPRCSGTIIGFRSPHYVQGINAAGYHVHFINAAHTGGGHVFRYTLTKGRLQIGIVTSHLVETPHSVDFLQANLVPEDLSAMIKTAEG